MERVYKNGATVYNRALHTKDNPYTKISNKLVNDTRLNFIEKGLILSILSNSDSYVLNTTYLQKSSGVGGDMFYFTIYYLTVLGYLQKKRIQGGVIWVVNEEAIKPTKKELESIINKPIYQDKLNKRLGFITSENTSNETVNSVTCVSTTNENTTCENTTLIRTKGKKKKQEKELTNKSNFSDLGLDNTNLTINNIVDDIPNETIISSTDLVD